MGWVMRNEQYVASKTKYYQKQIGNKNANKLH